jgi:predicted enzyme related to lactoylglutathione lyase
LVRAKERVLGFGGFFFRARDPKALARWYETHLGVDLTPSDYDHAGWIQTGGPTVFEPFPADSQFFGRAEQQWMLNFRVRDLAAIVRQLRDANIAVEVDAQDYPNGVFALTHDSEGNPVQLWEPRGAAAEAKR